MKNGKTQSKLAPGYRGPIILSVAAILFAAMAVFVRLGSYRGIPGSETTLVRFGFGALTVVGMHCLGFTRISFGRPLMFALRGITGGLAILLYFLSISSTKGSGATTLTNAVLLSNSYFVFTPLFGALFLRERLRRITPLVVCAALLGIYLVVRPHFGGVRLGDLYGIGSAMMAALAIVTVRELRKTEGAMSIFLGLCLVGIIISVAMMVVQKPVRCDAAGWAILAGMAVTGTIAQILLTYAYKYVPAGEGSLFSMTTVIYSSMAGILLFHEPLTLTFVAGAVLVFSGAAYLALTTRIAEPMG